MADDTKQAPFQASASVADAVYFSVFTYNGIKYATTLTGTGISWSRFGEKGSV